MSEQNLDNNAGWSRRAVVLVGDSHCRGTAFPPAWKRYIYPGYVVDEILALWKDATLDADADAEAAVVVGGANDLGYGRSPEFVADRIALLCLAVGRVLGLRPERVWAAAPWHLGVQAQCAVERRLSERYGLERIVLHVPDPDDDIGPDGLHLNEDGQRALAAEIERQIQEDEDAVAEADDADD